MSSISMLVEEQGLLSLSLVLHTLYVFPLCRNHTGRNKHALMACFSLGCNLLLALHAMQVVMPFIIILRVGGFHRPADVTNMPLWLAFPWVVIYYSHCMQCR